MRKPNPGTTQRKLRLAPFYFLRRVATTSGDGYTLHTLVLPERTSSAKARRQPKTPTTRRADILF